MQRSTLPLGLGVLKKWKEEKGCLKNELPFQRHAGVWSNFIQSNLVWSILADSYIPPIVLLKDKEGEDGKGKDIFVYQILDGLQRLTTLFSFINNEFSIHSSTPEVEVDGTVFDLAGYTFSELSQECQEVIMGYRFSVQCLENYSFEEAERLFFNINSGISLSTIQKSKAKLGTELIGYLNGMLGGSFFTQGINITEAQAKREDDLCILLQAMLLLDNRHEGFEYKNISTGTCLSYAEKIRNHYNLDKQEMLKGLVGYLDEAFPNKNKFLRKNNTPIAMVCAKVAMEEGIDPASFRGFINDFASGVNPAYEEASGSGNVKAVKVQMRLRVMFLEMCKYFRFDADMLQKPFAEGIPLLVHSDVEQSEEEITGESQQFSEVPQNSAEEEQTDSNEEPLENDSVEEVSVEEVENAEVTEPIASPIVEIEHDEEFAVPSAEEEE